MNLIASAGEIRVINMDGRMRKIIIITIVPIFKASDFTIVGEIPSPTVTGKINLL